MCNREIKAKQGEAIAERIKDIKDIKDEYTDFQKWYDKSLDSLVLDKDIFK